MAKGHNPHIEFGFGLWLRMARRFRVGVIAFWCVMAALGLWLSLSLLGVNTDTSDMIDERAPYRLAQAEFEAAFPGLNDQILLIIQSDSPDGLSIYSQELTQALSQSDQVREVSHPPSDPFFQKNGLLYLETDALEDQLAQLSEAAPLIERLSQSPTNQTLFETLIQLVERGEGNETANGLLLGVADTLAANIDGRRQALSWQRAFEQQEGEQGEQTEQDGQAELYQTVITLDPILDHTRVRAAAPIQELIEQLTGQDSGQVSERTQVKAEVFVTGNPVLRADELNSVSEGIGLAFLISFIIVGVVLLFALRSPLLVFFVLLSLIISILITSGLAALIYGELNLVSVAFTVLMVGLGVDFAIHLLMHLQSKRDAGLSVPAALYRTSRGVGTALVLTAPSTALAFLAFVPTQFVGISQLGVVAAIGVIIAFLVATSLLTAIFSYLPLKAKKPEGDEKTGQNIRATNQISLQPAHRNYLAIAVIVLGLGALSLMPRAQFDADPMALRDQNAASVKAFDLLFDSPETVPYRLSVLTESNAENNDEIQSLAAQLNALDSVDSVRGLQDFIPEDQYDKLDLISYAAIGLEFALSENVIPSSPIEDPAAHLQSAQHLQNALMGRDDRVARRLNAALTPWIEAVKTRPALWNMSEQDMFLYWPYQQARLRAQISADVVGIDDLPEGITRRYRSANNLERLEILPANDVRDADLRRDFVTQVTRAAPKATGSARSVQDAGDIVQASMVRAIIVALLAVAILLYYVVRNIKLVLIMLAPLMLAAVLTTATGILLSLPYNFANVIVLPLLIGIGVDSSLHLALQNRKGHKTALKTVSAFDNITPRAVIFSAVTTIASFGSLSFSAHRGTASMGLLLMIAIVWVLICTLLVTPALLDWTSRKRDKS